MRTCSYKFVYHIFLLLLSMLSCGCGNDELPSDGREEEKPTPPATLEYEWDAFKIPITAADGKVWELQSQSDDFNYTMSANDKSSKFYDKWTDFYHNNWTGPAPTKWQRDHIAVSDGYLRIRASRPDNVENSKVSSGESSKEMPSTYTGCITSKTQVTYPAYVEAYAKIANSTLASDVWMLSSDDTQEIDIIEAYGSDRCTDDYGKKYYGSDRIHLSHHVFIRSPFQDYQPTDAGSWYKDTKGTIWRKDFHRVGVYWENPYSLKYYIDGVLVRSVDKSMIDPKNYTNDTGLTKGMDIIINMEDQSWRAINGLTPTSSELANEEDNTFLVDWIRVYKLVDK